MSVKTCADGVFSPPSHFILNKEPHLLERRPAGTAISITRHTDTDLGVFF